MNLLLRFANFRSLYFGKLFCMMGDRYLAIALSWWILHLNIENSNSLVGLVSASATLAGIIGGPFMGILADRYSKRSCLMLASLIPVIIVSTLVFTLPLIEQMPYSLIGFYFLMTLFSPMIMTASTSGLSAVVPPDELPKAVALDGSADFIGPAIGSTLTGVLVSLLGITGAIATNVAFYLLAFICFWQIKTVFKVKETIKEDQPSGNVKEEMSEGFKFILQNKFILKLISIFCLANFLMTPIMIAIPIIITDVIKGSALNMSMLELCLALGAIIMSLLLSSMKLQLSIRMVLTWDLIVSGVIFLMIAKTTNLYALAVCMLIIGMGIGLTNAVIMTEMQSLVPDALKGRVFSLVGVSVTAISPLALVLTGYASDAYGIMSVIFINGAAFLFLALACHLLLKESDLPTNLQY